MKWIVGFLLVLNAGLFLWATGHRPDSTEFIRPAVNAETMMLLTELAPPSRAPKEQPAAGQTTESPFEPVFCLRIGPFHDTGLAAQAEKELAARSLSFESRTVKAREIRAIRVYLGPFESSSQVQAQKKKLEENGITDFYVKREVGQPDIISLGLFSQSTGAEALAGDLGERGVSVETRAENRLLDPTYWLEFETNRATRVELTSSDWGDKRTRLTEFPCP